MKVLKLTCTLLSDVVLSSQAATEGFYESLDYIPGAKFLGILAGTKGLYDLTNPQRTLDLFHNGCVQFGDAHPIISDDQPYLQSYKIPASWQCLKGENPMGQNIILFHSLPKEDKNLQLEQIKKGYFTLDGKLLKNIDQQFSIKSAYDGKKYRADDGKMYGYFSLRKGTKWYFEVTVEKPEYEELILKHLQGRKRMGRSSSAEYGLIDIQLIARETFASDNRGINPGLILVYAVSNLCFYDDYGKTTLSPDPVKHFFLPIGSKINWEKSQVRTRNYLTWNKHRRGRDADRLIIEKGSVFAIDLSNKINTSIWDEGIGAHRNEGFGKILVNPLFLIGKNSKLDLQLTETSICKIGEILTSVVNGDTDELIFSYIHRQRKAIETEYSIDKQVNDFIDKIGHEFKSVTASQWGQVRIAAKHSKTTNYLKELLFNDDFGICTTGQAEVHWRNCRNALKNFIFQNSELQEIDLLDLTMKIASEMAKTKKNKDSYGK